MSYHEKRTIVSVIIGIIVLTAYCVYAFERFNAGTVAADDMKAWAAIILVFVGIGVVAAIVIQIVFHILLSITTVISKNIETGQCDDKEIEKSITAAMVTDEMDKLIELKSMRVGFIAAGVGFVAALASQLLSFPPAVLLNVMFIAFSIGSILEGLAQMYFYRRGIRNG